MNTPEMRIFLVDDNEDINMQIADLLYEAGYCSLDLVWVSSYEAALAHLDQQEQFDVYLIDYRLGLSKYTGLDLIQELRARDVRAPIIMLTAERDHAVDLAAMQAGAVDYLDKGVLSPQLLERALRYAAVQAQTLDALRESEERYMLAMQGANDGLWDWNIKTNTIYFSPRWKAMLGYADEHIDSTLEAWFNLVHPDDLPSLRAAIEAHLAGSVPHLEREYRMRAHDGSYCWVLCRGVAVRNAAGTATRMAGSQTDITKRKEFEAQLARAALYDRLTGLPNRALFMERLAQATRLAQRHKEYLFAVFFLDLDGFKPINDQLGHLIGDQVLVEVSDRLKANIRACDIVARFGGDEFAILIDNLVNFNHLTHVVERIQQQIALAVQLDDAMVFVKASIGIAISVRNYPSPEDMLRDADAAMYKAKAHGPGCYEIAGS